MNSLLHSTGLPKSSPAQCYTLSFTSQKIGVLACSVYITHKNVGPVWCWSCMSKTLWLLKIKEQNRTFSQLPWQDWYKSAVTVSLQKGACTPHSMNTWDYSMAPKLFFFSLYLLSFFVLFIWFSCTVLWWSISHFWYIIIWQNFKFTFIVSSYPHWWKEKSKTYIHCFVLPPLMEKKKTPKILHSFFVLPPLMERKVKCIVFLVLLLFLFFLLVFVSSLFLAAISNTLISIQNQTYFLANKSQRTENLKEPAWTKELTTAKVLYKQQRWIYHSHQFYRNQMLS